MTKPLYRTIIIIWSEDNPDGISLTTLAGNTESGQAYCSRFGCTLVEDPAVDRYWDGTTFFSEEPEEQAH